MPIILAIVDSLQKSINIIVFATVLTLTSLEMGKMSNASPEEC